MRIALIGSGAMGGLVSTLASAGGDEVGAILSSREASKSVEDLAAEIRGHDVAIDFSISAAVVKNAGACARAGVPLVEGTTGCRIRMPRCDVLSRITRARLSMARIFQLA